MLASCICLVLHVLSYLLQDGLSSDEDRKREQKVAPATLRCYASMTDRGPLDLIFPCKGATEHLSLFMPEVLHPCLVQVLQTTRPAQQERMASQARPQQIREENHHIVADDLRIVSCILAGEAEPSMRVYEGLRLSIRFCPGSFDNPGQGLVEVSLSVLDQVLHVVIHLSHHAELLK